MAQKWSLMIIILVSLSFAIPSIFSSTLSIIYNTTSTLKESDYNEMVKKIEISADNIEQRRQDNNKEFMTMSISSKDDIEDMSSEYQESQESKRNYKNKEISISGFPIPKLEESDSGAVHSSPGSSLSSSNSEESKNNHQLMGSTTKVIPQPKMSHREQKEEKIYAFVKPELNKSFSKGTADCL
eukprot:CAMPEP_0196995766 /NCGR_PEP_ID=MMETSP1380-20130617/1817_1 /TAXON_ID=5936 /ORGANISM="Euplotes crassus, Strain CT5" /LENGTH=183 /DNA_ID=CAMNT_0042411545 /DNA_START=2182 /DNA_END=2733 /DNA_ORIENTATION=+